MTDEKQRIPTSAAGLLSFFVVLVFAGFVGTLDSSAHRGPWLGVLAVATVGSVVFGLIVRRSLRT